MLLRRGKIRKKNSILLLGVSFLLTVFLSGCYGTITGKVVDAETGEPVEGAVSLFDESTQATYRAQFAAFASILNQIGSELGQIQMVTVEDNRAEYEIITTRSGSTYSYHLVFVWEQERLWKIRVF